MQDDERRPDGMPHAIYKMLMLLLALLFSVYMFIYVFLGGDAIQGSSMSGHYYLSQHGGENSREVSRQLFLADVWIIRLGVALAMCMAAIHLVSRSKHKS